MSYAPDFLDLDRVTVDTPEAIYVRHRLLYADGVAHIIARSGYPVASAPGVITTTGPHTWRLDGETGPWLIDRAKGCGCSGQPVAFKAPV